MTATLALAAAGCSGDDPGRGAPAEPATTTTEPAPTTTPTTAPPTTAPEPDPPPTLPAEVPLAWEPVAAVAQPTDVTPHPGTGVLYAAEKGGRIVALDGAGPRPVLDITGEVSTGGEQGLLGLAFAPDGRHLYFDFTDRAGDTRLEEVAVTADGGLDATSRRLVLAVDQPASNHNGGHLAFGPDGHLWFALGDGGGGGDRFENAQNLVTLLGAVLRIAPGARDAGAYGIPPDNPFVGRTGARPEIAVWGLRNPWRFSFDRATGDLWIGDVGQGAWEEIDHLPAGRILGANLGWPHLEGSHPFRGSPPPDAVGPVHEYTRSDGQSVAGGVVYRGEAIPVLRGAYLFADTYTADLWALTAEGRRTLLPVPGGLVAGFAEDADGEVLALSLERGVFRLVPG